MYVEIIVDVELAERLAATGAVVIEGYGYMRPDGVGIIPIGALGT